MTEDRAAYKREWYARNVDRQRLSMRNKARENKRLLVEARGAKCSDCGGTFHPAVFDFDHRDPNEKSRDVGQLCVSSLAAATAEADKCDMVCANCHRMRTLRSKAVNSKIRGSSRSSKFGKQEALEFVG